MLAAGSGITLTQTAQEIEIAAAAVESIKAEGQAALAGDVVLAAGSGVTLTQTAQEIEIAAAAGGGAQLAYAEVTAGAVTIASTSGASPTTIVSSGAVVYAASRIRLEWYVPDTTISAGIFVIYDLWDDATDLGQVGFVYSPGVAGIGVPLMGARYLTPSAGSHTYMLRAHKSGGTATANAGAGGVQAMMPIWFRVSLA